MQGVNGVFGFLNRVWRLMIDERAEAMQLNAAVVDRPPTADENRVLHQTIAAVTDDIRDAGVQHGHRADDGVHELLHHGERAAARGAGEVRAAAVAVRAAHRRRAVASARAHESLAYEPWPEFDPALAKEDTIEVPVQINGKVRSKITVPTGRRCSRNWKRPRGRRAIAELLAANKS